MKGIHFWIPETEAERIPEDLKCECEKVGIRLYLGEDIVAPSKILSKDKADLKEDLYVISDEEIAVRMKESGFAVLGYRDNGQDFRGISWVMDPFDPDGEYPVSFFDRIYRRCKKLPWDILETEHLLVRETTVEDVEDFYRIYAEPSITKYTENLFEDPAMERAYTENYRDTIYSLYGFGMWTVLLKETGQVIGRAGISMRDGYEEPELGFIIGVPWQRKGYAYEVCSAILTYTKEELDFQNMICFIKEENTASIRLSEKLGFYMDGQAVLGEEDYLLFRKEL